MDGGQSGRQRNSTVEPPPAMALKYRGKSGPLAPLETESWADKGKRVKRITARDRKK